MKFNLKTCLLIIAFGLVGCRGTSDLGGKFFEENGETGIENSVSNSNNLFALDLYGVVKKDVGNVFMAPFSVSSALTMTSAGAAGQTLTELTSTLHLQANEMNNHLGYSNLVEELSADEESHGYTLAFANRLFGQEGFPFKKSFLKLTGNFYDAEMQSLDFSKMAENSRLEINKWVSLQTKEKIKDLLAPGLITEDTKLVLTNAIYFKGLWEKPFEEDLTEQAYFYVQPENMQTVSMMNRKTWFNYGRNSELDIQAVELPYKNKLESGSDVEPRKLSMVVLVPNKKDGLANLEANLTSKTLNEVISSFGDTPAYVDLYLPKFKVESSFVLNDALKELNIDDAFDEGRADFSRIAPINPQNNLFIDKVVHKTFINIDEVGTEAAGATAVIVVGRSVEPDEFESVKADRPFIYFIRDMKSGAILFMGRYSDPRS